MNGRRLAGWTIGLGAMLGLVCLLTSGSRPTRLRRYVSDPLPDGRRYTFLYPDRLQLVPPDPVDHFYLVQFRRGVSFWSLAHGMVSSGLVGYGSSQWESVNVTTYPAGKWRNRGWWRDNSPRYRSSMYYLSAHDAGARDDFVFHYEWHPSQDRWCRPVSNQIVDSFRILAPGEALLVDAAPRAVTASKEPNAAGNDQVRR